MIFLKSLEIYILASCTKDKYTVQSVVTHSSIFRSSTYFGESGTFFCRIITPTPGVVLILAVLLILLGVVLIQV